VLAIDDIEDRVHGRQRLARFHAHHGGYGFAPIHVHEATTGNLVAVIPRLGKIPDGNEVALELHPVIRASRKRWPRIDVLVRGDSP